MSWIKTLKNDYSTILESLLVPNEYYDSITEIELAYHSQKGFDTLILDIDNTLITYEEKELSLQYYNWIQSAKLLGFKLYLISNNSKPRRMKHVFDQLKLTGLYFACKPFTFSTKEFMIDNAIDPSKTIVIGDQLFKDVILGNWLQSYTILVKPMSLAGVFFQTIQFEFEKYLLRKFGVI
jgi:HAD superfamily (subfamily IIIA) phosphatase, TIGR01668